MSATSSLGMPAPPKVWHMYRAMVGVGLLCGLIIVSVFQVTRPVIERNKAEALQRAIFQVLPAARSSATFRFGAGERFEKLEGRADGEALVYAGYDADGELAGIAVEAQGMGYQDVIHVLYGYSFEQDAIVGIRVLESRETPGLGDKIESDPGFLANFERLVVTLTADLSAIAHPIEFVKKGQKVQPWQIDGITGATISSKAIAGILSGSTAYWIPRIRRNLDAFRVGE
ncbi:MAG TPA: FMN-binding protein [Myxococcota bacterium]